MSDIPAGWYPDPAAVGAPAPPPLRYWDGQQWTEHVHIPVAPTPPVQPGLPASQATTPDGAVLASWWRRVGATVIDGIFTGILSLVVTLPMQIDTEDKSQQISNEFQTKLDNHDPGAFSWYLHQMLDLYRDHAGIYLLAILIAGAAWTLFLHLKGGTPGQLLTGLRVRLRERPGQLSWARAGVRILLATTLPSAVVLLAVISNSLALVGIVSLAGFVWQLLDPLWAAWDTRKQTLHDKIVATNVIRVR